MSNNRIVYIDKENLQNAKVNSISSIGKRKGRTETGIFTFDVRSISI